MRIPLLGIVFAIIMIGCDTAPPPSPPLASGQTPTAVLITSSGAPVPVHDKATGTPVFVGQPKAPEATTSPEVSRATPSSAYSDSVSGYLDWLDRTIGEVDDASLTLSNLKSPPVHDDAWKSKVNVALSVWTRAYQDAQGRQAPPPLSDGHLALVKSLGEYSAAAAVISKGAAQGDDALFASGLDQAVLAGNSVIGALGVLKSELGGGDVGIPVVSTPNQP